MHSTHLSPEEQTLLATRVQRGDPAAEGEIVRLFTGRIRAMIAVRTRGSEAAEDLTQETLMAVLVALRAGRLRAPDRLAAFVYGIARNLVSDHLRGARARPAAEPLTPEMCPASAVDPLEEEEREVLVRNALDVLPAGDRQILLLTLVEGLKIGAIAERLGLTAEVARTRKARALKKIVSEVRLVSRSGPRSHHSGGDE